jgi:hypothetical protein
MYNRIVAKIEAQRLDIETKLNNNLLTPEKIQGTSDALNMPLDEYVIFQELKSLAVLHNILTVDEGMTIYSYLGEAGPDYFNQQPIEVKVVLTKLFSELLSMKMQGQLV